MELLDARYFFFDDNYIGKATSHIARMALTDSLRLFCDNTNFLNSSWYEQLAVVGKSLIILGFTVKQMILSAICAYGCPLVSVGLEPAHSLQDPAPITCYQLDFPVLMPPNNNQEPAAQLFVPVSRRCRYIDGVLVRWNLKAKSVLIAPIQITLATGHVASDVLFMESHWSSMVAHLTDWKIHARFVRIKESHRVPYELTGVAAKEYRNTRGPGAKQLHPPYNVITLTVRQVNSRIDDKLRAARGSPAMAARLYRYT